MSWQLIERGEWCKGTPLEEGTVAILSDGRLVFRREDLQVIGVTDCAALLADTSTLRLGVRRPKEHEVARAVRVQTVTSGKGADTGRRSILATRAFKALGLTSKACAGRVELTVKEDSLLIINLAGIEFNGNGDDEAADKKESKAKKQPADGSAGQRHALRPADVPAGERRT